MPKDPSRRLLLRGGAFNGIPGQDRRL